MSTKTLLAVTEAFCPMKRILLLTLALTFLLGSTVSGKLNIFYPGKYGPTDKELANLQLTELQSLNLSYSKVTDDGLQILERAIQLQSLSLHGTFTTDAGLVHLKGLTKLQSLDLGYTNVTALDWFTSKG